MKSARPKIARHVRLAAALGLLLAGGLRLDAATAGRTAQSAGEADFARDGKKLHVAWSEPRIVEIATKPERWGFFQFPSIGRMDDGTLLVRWTMHPDSIKSYGQHSLVWRKSTDGGRSWQPTTAEQGALTLATRLPNGDRVAIHTPLALKASELKLPPPAGTAVETYSKAELKFYPMAQLPPALQGVYLKRFRPGETEGQLEHDTLEDAGALRYELEGLLPVVWWGDIQIDRDGSLVAGVYPGFYRRADGSVDGQMAASFHRSTDLGRSWKNIGRIPYQPDTQADAKSAGRAGFTEPAFQILRDGTFLCVMRTTDGAGDGPLYASRSRDRGVTWTKPEIFASAGVLPQLLQLENGTLVLAAGRPGVQVRFALDAAGGTWSEALELVPWQNDKDHSASCGYTGLVATGPDRFVIVYSDFRHRNAQGEERKAIAVREFSVSIR